MTVTRSVTLLYGDDLESVVAFYASVLGWEVINSWSPDERLGWVLLGPPGGEGARVMYNRPMEDSATSPKGQPFQAVVYFYVTDIAAAHARAESAGAAPSPVEPNFNMREFFVVDPAGYHLYFAQVEAATGKDASL